MGIKELYQEKSHSSTVISTFNSLNITHTQNTEPGPYFSRTAKNHTSMHNLTHPKATVSEDLVFISASVIGEKK